MIDTHSHLNFMAFEHDFVQVADEALREGVKAIFLVGTTVQSSQKAVHMSEEYPYFYAVVGIHPHHAKQYLGNESSLLTDVDQIGRLASHPKVVAIGEIGLDYHVYSRSERYEAKPIDKDLIVLQKDLLTRQLAIASLVQKPVVIHSRKAKEEVLTMIADHNNNASFPLRGVFHCFEGGKKMAQRVVEAGFMISFTGNLTYDHGRAEVSKTIPLQNLLLETDCPYMLPRSSDAFSTQGILMENENLSANLRSEPKHVKIIGHYHAYLRNISADEVFKQTTANAQRLFKIDVDHAHGD